MATDALIETQGDGRTPWRSLSIPVPNLEPILTKIKDFVDKLKAVISLVVGLVDMILSFISALADPLAALIRALLDQIRALLNQYLEDAGLYALFVPFGKRMMYNTFTPISSQTRDATPDATAEMRKPMLGSSEGTSVSLFTSTNDPNKPSLTAQQRKFMANANQFSGGNAGFYRTVCESLADSRDHCRPQFLSPDDYVAGGVMLFGSDFDPFGFLNSFFKFSGMFGDIFAASSGIPDLPKPRNLRGEVVLGPHSRPHGEEGKFMALLQWDSMNLPVHSLPDLGGVIVMPIRMAVIAVRNNLASSAASNVMDLFGTKALTKGMHVGDAWVIEEKIFVPGETMYLTEELQSYRSDVWTFFVAWSLYGFNKKDNPAKAKPSDIGYWYLSNAVRLTPMQTASAGTPPDWIRTPSVSELLPPLAWFMRRLVIVIETLASYVPSAIEHLRKYVDFMRREILRYESIIQNILTEFKKLLDLLNIQTLGGIYTKMFSGKGGNAFFTSSLAESLAEGYPNAPPFHNGDEYVTGLILLAGGAQPKVAAAQPLLELMFGDATTGEGGIANDTADLMDSLGAQVDLIQETWSPTPKEESLEGLVLCNRPEPKVVPFGADLNPIVP
jgi:hypothetical protein